MTGERSKPKRNPHKAAKKATPKTTVRKDPMKEYAESIKGEGAKAMSLLDADCASNVKMWVSTGSLALDTLMNGKGIPTGRITEIYGPSHLGKSTLLDQMFTQVQRIGGFGVLCDTEAARDHKYTVSGLGVDPAKLKILQFDDPTQIHIEGIANKVIASVDFWRTEFPETPIVLGWDSLGGTTTQAEMAKDVGERNVAAAAKAMRDVCRKLVGRLARSNVAIVIINHQYTNINTMGGRPASRLTYAGDALRLAATLRLELFFKGVIKDSDGVVIGRQIGARLDKNRFGWCRDTTLAVLTGIGTDNAYALFDTLGDAKRLVTNGSWSTLKIDDDEFKFQGAAGLSRKCLEDPTLFNRLVGLYTEITGADLHV